MAGGVTIDQTLHGYNEGHRLLATSRELPSRSERLLLELSDLSGDGMVSGFEEYITGYLLPERNEKLYAFAKTWYAPEMERPGCVWTQTLIINLNNLKHLTGLKALLALFSRPHRGESFSKYNEKLSLPEQNPSTLSYRSDRYGHPASLFQKMLKNLFYSIYQYKRPAVVLAQDGHMFEQLVLALWLQQWPALRASFSFCTGALAPRFQPDGRPFMLQVAPEKNHYLFAKQYAEIGKPIKKTMDIIKVNNLPPKKLKDWYEIPISNLMGGDQERYVDFLWEFGPTLPALRTSFSRLTQFYWRIQNVCAGQESIALLTSILSQRFPKATDAPEIKTAIYASKTAWSFLGSQPLNLEINILNEIIQTEHYDIFDASSLEVKERITQLWHESPNVALQIISRCFDLSLTELNPIRLAVLNAAARLVTAQELILMTNAKTELLETVLNFNPRIAESPLLWKADENRQRYLFARLQKVTANESEESFSDVGQIKWSGVVEAMLTAGSDLFADSLEYYLGNELATIILTWHKNASNQDRSLIGSGWLQIIEKHPEQAVDWLRMNGWEKGARDVISTHALIAGLLDPHDPKIRTAGIDVWMDLAEHADAEITDEEKIPVMSFLLALGLSNQNISASRLVAHSFQSVYDAASADALPWHSWTQLERLAPSHGLIWPWDKCRRLEEALLKKIIQSQWPPDILLQAVKSPETFQRIILRTEYSSSRRKLFRRAYDLVKDGGVYVNYEIRELLKRYRS